MCLGPESDVLESDFDDPMRQSVTINKAPYQNIVLETSLKLLIRSARNIF